MWDFWDMFYFRQYEDCSMGDSTSGKSDKLFQRDKGKRQHMYDPGKGGVHAIKHFFFFFGRKFLLVSWSFYKSWETIVTMKDFSAFLDMRRSKNWTNGINSWEYLTVWKSVLPVAWSTGCLISTLYPELHQGILEISSYSSTRFNPHRGRWQGPMASANLWLT